MSRSSENVGDRSRDTRRRPTREPSSRWRGSRDTSGRQRTRSTRSPPPTFERPTKPWRQPSGIRDAKNAPSKPSTRADVPESIDAIVDLLTEAGLVPERPRALLEGTAAQPSRLTQIRAADGVPPRHGPHGVRQAESRAGVSRQYAHGRVLRSVQGLYGPGSLRCGRRHLQPGSRALASALAGS